MRDWNPIETAPRGESVLDLWVVSDANPTGRRIPDCRPAGGGCDAWVDSDGRYVNGLNYYDDEGDECLAPGNDPKPEETVVRTINRRRVTHWMPRPAAPE